MFPELDKSMSFTEKNLVLGDILQFVGDTLHIAYEIRGSFNDRRTYVVFTKRNYKMFLDVHEYYNEYLEAIHLPNAKYYSCRDYKRIILKIGYHMISEIERIWLELLRSE